MKLFILISFVTTLLIRSISAIVGGSEVNNISQYPYMASIARGSHSCGGVVIGSRFILTSASCVSGREPISFKARVNSRRHASGGQQLAFNRILIHPNYDPVSKANDIALMTTTTNTGVTAAQIPLTPLEDPIPGAFVQLVGWGTTSDGAGSLPATLRNVSLPVTDNSKCQEVSSAGDKVFCSGYDFGGKGACKADEGGPVIAKNGVVVGLITDNMRCAQVGYPDVNVNLSEYSLWILLNEIL